MTPKGAGKATLTPEAAAAMTVNERLFAAGLLADFDAAATPNMLAAPGSDP